MNLEQSVKALGALTLYFPRANLPEPTILAWARELLEFESVDVLAGISKHAREATRFEPTLGDIIQATREARMQRAELERMQRANVKQIGSRTTDAKYGPEVNAAGLQRVKQAFTDAVNRVKSL